MSIPRVFWSLFIGIFLRMSRILVLFLRAVRERLRHEAHFYPPLLVSIYSAVIFFFKSPSVTTPPSSLLLRSKFGHAYGEGNVNSSRVLYLLSPTSSRLIACFVDLGVFLRLPQAQAADGAGTVHSWRSTLGLFTPKDLRSLVF